MFFMLWLLCNVALHFVLSLLYVEYIKNYVSLTPADQMNIWRNSFEVIHAKFLSDAFWIQADDTPAVDVEVS